MEYRELGKTGLKTSILGFGGFHLLEIPLKSAEKLLGEYLDRGGNYIETAASYGDGESERKIGHSVMHRRDDFILVSKTGERSKSGAEKQINRTLKNLQTDHIDGLLMHAVGSIEELDTLLAEDGAYQAAIEAKKVGKIGFIGISMHGWPGTLIEALQRDKFDAVMSTINYYDHFNYPEIESVLLPLAKQKNTGVILMKPVADGYLYRSAETAFRYAFSRPVSVVVAGINNEQMLYDDLRFAENYTPMTEHEITSLYMDAPELGNYVCRQCGLCKCTYDINIPEVFACEGYYDRQMFRGEVENIADYALMERLRFWFGNQEHAQKRYHALHKKAKDCNGCGDCLSSCPYNIAIPNKMQLVDYKLGERTLF